MHQSLNELYGQVIESILKLEPLLEEAMAQKPRVIEDLANKLFALRECINRLKEVTSTFTKAEALVEKMITAIYLASHHAEDKIKTPYVTAECIPSIGTRVPGKKDPLYEPFLTFLGIPKELQDHEVVRVHYPGWKSYYTSLQAKGIQLPEGIALTEYPESYVKTIKRQSLRGTINGESPETRTANPGTDNSADGTGEAGVPF